MAISIAPVGVGDRPARASRGGEEVPGAAHAELLREWAQAMRGGRAWRHEQRRREHTRHLSAGNKRLGWRAGHEMKPSGQSDLGSAQHDIVESVAPILPGNPCNARSLPPTGYGNTHTHARRMQGILCM